MDAMVVVAARNWWLLVLRGVLAVIFAVLTFLWPASAIAAFALLFGAYAFVDGVFAVVAALERIGRQERWGAMLIEGLLGIAAGIITFFWPGITALLLVYFIGAWAVVTGVFEIVAAIQLRREIENEWLLAVTGVLSVLFGLFVFIFPGAGALSLALVIAAYAFVFGILLIAVGLRLRNLQPHGSVTAPPVAPPPM
jgi:uncharacterized membrane protein HdeD (DUF308 family)